MQLMFSQEKKESWAKGWEERRVLAELVLPQDERKREH